MRLRFVSGAALLLAAAAVVLPGSALSVAQIQEDQGLADFDSRTGKIAPTSAQRAHAKKLKAKVSWGQFGTPAAITRRGKFLARGIRGKTAPVAARWYLNRHKALFGLRSLDSLRLESANRLVGSNGYAVNYRQVFEGVTASEGGLVTVGVSGTRKKGWKVAYISSTLTRATELAGSVQFSSVEGWARGARIARLPRSVANVLSRKARGGWTQLGVAGLDQPQRVRLVAFPTVREGVVPAYESYVLDGKRSLGARTFIDARNGRLLARYNIVENLSSGLKQAAVTVTPFSGALPAVDGGCGPDHAITVPAGIRAFSGFANATNPLTDIVLQLFRVGNPTPLITADTVFTPERFRLEPAGGVPPGDYFARVCDFVDGGAPPAPLTYSGTFTLDDTPAPPAYWAKWTVTPASFPLGSASADPWNRPATDTRETWCWRAAPGCDLVVGNLASRAPWDHDLVTDTPTFTTRGNNAITAESWTNPSVPAPFQFQPTVGLPRDYTFPWTDSWNQSDCNTSLGFTPGVSWDVSAAVTNLFVAHNRMHDFSYFLGFTEENWNAQDRNFGLTEAWRQGDPVLGDVQSGATTGTRNNASMSTVPEGGSSVSNMYFFQPIAGSFYVPCADGDFDVSVIGHEYGHMIENRMIGKGVARAGFHAGSMGEAFGDLVGMEYLNENSHVPVGSESPYVAGAYDTGSQHHGIRNYDMSFPMAGANPEPGKELSVNSLNFGDIGYDVTGNEVHADGEIWVAANFRIRQLLAERYDDDFAFDDDELQADCANGLVNVTRCPGNRRWMQLYFDAMLLMPPNTSMVQGRDAILAADLMRFGGANQKELSLGFARSGLGRNASSTNGGVNSDTDPLPDFDAVGTKPATVKFVATDRDGGAVSARIYVGHYEARVSPIADTNPATTASSNVDDTASFAPGTYEFTAHAPGYGHVRFRERLRSGRQETIRLEFARNWASSASGATATTTDGAASVANLIDDTEATNWSAPATNTAGAISVDGKAAVINLGGTDDIRVRSVQVSAMPAPGNSRFAALRQFELWACNADEGDDCSTTAGFSREYTSPVNAFPGTPPRPIAPQLLLRTFNVPDFEATHIRFVVRSTQCTGGPGFQGDQDADPANNPDCDTNVPANSTRNFARTAEFQVFSQTAEVD